MEIHFPTTEELLLGHKIFEKNETRWHEYWEAVDGVTKGLTTDNVILAATSLKPFLESWNWGYYRFKPEQLATLRATLQQLLTDHLAAITAFRAGRLPR